jgi:hypothetical protein
MRLPSGRLLVDEERAINSLTEKHLSDLRFEAKPLPDSSSLFLMYQLSDKGKVSAVLFLFF